MILLQAEATIPAFEALSRAAALAPEDPETLDALGRAAMAGHRVDDAVALMTRLAEDSRGGVRARVETARLLAAIGRYNEAVGAARQALADEPRNPTALAQLASIYADVQDVARLDPVVRALEAHAPGAWPTLYYSAVEAFLQGRIEQCVSLAERAAPLAPPDGRTHNLLGAAYANIGRPEQAKRAFEASLARDPHDATAYVNLGELEIEGGHLDRAAAYFSEALTLEPGSAAARKGLARAWALLGETARARALEGAPRASLPIR